MGLGREVIFFIDFKIKAFKIKLLIHKIFKISQIFFTVIYEKIKSFKILIND